MKKTFMKKALSIMLTLVLLLSITACTENDVETGVINDVETEEATTLESETPQTKEETTEEEATEAAEAAPPENNTMMYQGHASVRIVTPEGKVIYVDPFKALVDPQLEGYDVPADLILITHCDLGHDSPEAIQTQNAGCEKITNEDALVDGEYKTFELDYVKVEAVEMGPNRHHHPGSGVGYILTLSNDVTIYVSGDSSRSEQMETFAARNIDYAFIYCSPHDLNIETASENAALINAKHSIPYHLSDTVVVFFVEELADAFEVDGKMVLKPGEVITLTP